MAKTFTFLLLVFYFTCIQAQPTCHIKKIVFSAGETLSYEIYYHWGFIWANAGQVNFSVNHVESSRKKVFYFVGEGNTYPSYDWFFKVRDKFETWADTLSLKPYRYIRNTMEGSTKVHNKSYFDYAAKQVVCYKIFDDKITKDSVSIKACTFDVLSMIYYARCVDYSLYKVGAKIPISLYLDGEINDSLFIQYLGHEKIKSQLGLRDCIVFSPLLISGTIFTGGQGMKVWVTNDEQKVPVQISTPVIVGEIQAKIKSISGPK
jgi:hypothetical protein